MSAFTKTIMVSLSFKYSFLYAKMSVFDLLYYQKVKLPNGLFHPSKLVSHLSF